MNIVCIILYIYFVGDTIIRWITSDMECTINCNNEKGYLPGDLIVHDSVPCNNKGNLVYTKEQLLWLKDRTLHHRI